MAVDDDLGDVPSLVALGLRLRKARESKRWTLEKLSEKTRVSVRQIDNIERGNFKAIPSRTLVLGFTHALCQALKLPTDEIHATLKRDLYHEGDGSAHTPAPQTASPRRWFTFWR